jgi:Protein of unknown function (DUF3761)
VSLPLRRAVRPRPAIGLAALLLLLTACGPVAPTAPPAAPIPATTTPAVVTDEPSPSPSASPVAVTTTGPPVSVPAPAPAATQGGACPAGDYRNVDGTCVPRPTQAAGPPAGATAQCNDGSYSFSKHRSGTCSHHGGVRRWL